MQQTPVMILAGGQATRMGGGDKPLMLWRDRPLIEWLLDDLRKHSPKIAINANGDPQRFAKYWLAVVPDELPDCGPLSGILTAMVWASASGFSHVGVIAGDTVSLPDDLLERLGTGPSYAASLVNSEWRGHPTVGVWPVDLAAGLRDYLLSGERRVMGWAKSVGATEVRFDGEVFRNFNTPEDLKG